MIGRRDFLKQAAVVLGGSVSASVSAAVLAGGRARAASAAALLTDAQRALVARLTELIIPATDTPGAIAAGVPAFVELVVTDWYRPAERASFLEGLDALAAEARRRHGQALPDCNDAEQTALLAWAHQQGGDHRPAMFRTAPDPQAPFFWQLRELTIVGYYTSEVGATQALRHLPIPGRYDGDYPLAEAGRAWSEPR